MYLHESTIHDTRYARVREALQKGASVSTIAPVPVFNQLNQLPVPGVVLWEARCGY